MHVADPMLRAVRLRPDQPPRSGPDRTPPNPPPPLSGAPKTSRSLLSAATYAGASAGQRALALLLLPLYTAALSTAEYGRLSILLAVVSGAIVVLSAGFDFYQQAVLPAA